MKPHNTVELNVALQMIWKNLPDDAIRNLSI